MEQQLGRQEAEAAEAAEAAETAEAAEAEASQAAAVAAEAAKAAKAVKAAEAEQRRVAPRRSARCTPPGGGGVGRTNEVNTPTAAPLMLLSPVELLATSPAASKETQMDTQPQSEDMAVDDDSPSSMQVCVCVCV